MKIQPAAVAVIQKQRNICKQNPIPAEERKLERFVTGYLSAFSLWEDKEALAEMAGYLPSGALKASLLQYQKKMPARRQTP